MNTESHELEYELANYNAVLPVKKKEDNIIYGEEVEPLCFIRTCPIPEGEEYINSSCLTEEPLL